MLSSLTVPLKLVSFQVSFLLFINLTNVFMKLSVSSTSTTSMCTASVVRHVNNAPHHLILAPLYFPSIDPNRSTPVSVNGSFMASVQTEGRSLVKGSKFFPFLRLQNEHLLAILFISDLISIIHYFFLSIESMYSVPICSRFCMFLTMSLLMC